MDEGVRIDMVEEGCREVVCWIREGVVWIVLGMVDGMVVRGWNEVWM